MIKFISVILLASSFAIKSLAGYDCVSANGQDRVLIEELWILGLRATVQSQSMSQYYRYMNLNVINLKSLADHQSLKPINQELPGGYLFLMNAPNSGTNAVWSMEFTVVGGIAKALVTDKYGKTFDLQVQCSIN